MLEVVGLKNCSDVEYVIGIVKENKIGKRWVLINNFVVFLMNKYC